MNLKRISEFLFFIQISERKYIYERLVSKHVSDS